jgi:hypothetical protein
MSMIVAENISKDYQMGASLRNNFPDAPFISIYDHLVLKWMEIRFI